MTDEGTFCTTANVQYKAGANASSVSKAEGYVNQFVKEAEGYIMCMCREKFKANYGSLNAETKELLRLATSNMAAISVINFDMSGFTSRTEAEIMMNVLKTISDESIKLLQNQQTVTYSKT